MSYMQDANQQVADVVRLANTAAGVLRHLGQVLTLQVHLEGKVDPSTMAAAESAAFLLGVADANLHLLNVETKALYN